MDGKSHTKSTQSTVARIIPIDLQVETLFRQDTVRAQLSVVIATNAKLDISHDDKDEDSSTFVRVGVLSSIMKH